MTNQAIAERFVRLADLMEIRGDDYFKIRSYRNAADTLADWPTSLATIAKEHGADGLKAIPGIGKAISGKILELLEKGTFEAWEKLTKQTSDSVLELLSIDGVGVKTAATLFQRFKIASIEDLKRFVDGGGLELVDGIGEKTAERIKNSLMRN